ncbi:RNA ligase partner protein [Candidatus Roizmanbacteria bacterium]|nr:RNA ligase partner protein [Candidatus Roizmanbacteria bacterium]
MKKYILDANLFFNLETSLGMGEKTEAVIKTFAKYAKELRNQNLAEFFMPPKVVEEFLSFFENKDQAFLQEFLASVTVKSPDHLRSQFPAQVFYQLVDDIRQRSLRGLRLGEEEIELAARSFSGKSPLPTKEFQIAVGDHIKKFRQRYRRATRFGFLDSLADLDLIVLAKEQDGFLASADEGVIYWGRAFGVKEARLGSLRRELDSLLHRE